MGKINIKSLITEDGLGSTVAWNRVALSTASWSSVSLSTAEWDTVAVSSATWTSIGFRHIADYYIDSGDIIKEA